MCMGQNVRVDVRSHVCIWIEFLIFGLAGCFVKKNKKIILIAYYTITCFITTIFLCFDLPYIFIYYAYK